MIQAIPNYFIGLDNTFRGLSWLYLYTVILQTYLMKDKMIFFYLQSDSVGKIPFLFNLKPQWHPWFKIHVKVVQPSTTPFIPAVIFMVQGRMGQAEFTKWMAMNNSHQHC